MRRLCVMTGFSLAVGVAAVAMGFQTGPHGHPMTNARSVVSQSPVELAVLANPDGLYAPNGAPLFIISIPSTVPATQKLVEQHATWAKLSPAGKWVAVSVANPEPSNGLGPSLWVMKCATITAALKA